MRIARIAIKNFRGVKKGVLHLPSHAVLVGDNNIGKSTIFEAMDLVLGPERLSRRPVIDEHDFHAGDYIDATGEPIKITIEVVVVGLSEEQQRHFRDHIEWWKETDKQLLDAPPPEGTDVLGPVGELEFLAIVVVIVIVPQLLSYLFCSVTGSSGTILLSGQIVPFVVLGLVKFAAIAGGIMTSGGIDYGVHRAGFAAITICTGLASVFSSFTILFAYRNGSRIIDKCLSYVPARIRRAFRHFDAWASRNAGGSLP